MLPVFLRTFLQNEQKALLLFPHLQLHQVELLLLVPGDLAQSYESRHELRHDERDHDRVGRALERQEDEVGVEEEEAEQGELQQHREQPEPGQLRHLLRQVAEVAEVQSAWVGIQVTSFAPEIEKVRQQPSLGLRQALASQLVKCHTRRAAPLTTHNAETNP